uniref:NADH dehydrogenase subunit 6 n=1 Tax=Limassolla lingchuanensis TaxID=2704520 RepID=UPI0013E8FF1A|nr:NADH dehydrogenase subunit 6 [Limassolla lingchuanensis]QHR79697.1 NADH dehydrogenase subunit 6 [Limassolla lingchuanensis]
MKFYFIKIMILISSIIPILNNPMSLGFMLILQTMMTIFYMNTIMQSSWFIMITFLMMIGGLLILFTYMSSIASNEKFKIKLNMMFMLIIMLIIFDDMMMQQQIKEELVLNKFMMSDLSLMKIYNNKSMLLTMLMVLYLLLTMISVTKMVKHYKGPLRNTN